MKAKGLSLDDDRGCTLNDSEFSSISEVDNGALKREGQRDR